MIDPGYPIVDEDFEDLFVDESDIIDKDTWDGISPVTVAEGVIYHNIPFKPFNWSKLLIIH